MRSSKSQVLISGNEKVTCEIESNLMTPENKEELLCTVIGFKLIIFAKKDNKKPGTPARISPYEIKQSKSLFRFGTGKCEKFNF